MLSLEKSIYIRIIEFGIKKPDGFKFGEIINDDTLSLTEYEKKIVETYLKNAYINLNQTEVYSNPSNNETLFLATWLGGTWNDESTIYAINLDAHFKYIDYSELKQARENASEAKKLSIIAITISMIAAMISAVLPLYIALYLTQTMKIDQSQLNEITESLKNALPEKFSIEH